MKTRTLRSEAGQSCFVEYFLVALAVFLATVAFWNRFGSIRSQAEGSFNSAMGQLH